MAIKNLTLTKATTIALIAVCAIGLVPRAVKVVNPNPVPGDDAHAYFALAKSLYQDGTFGGPDFNNASDWSPGAPLLYAGMFHLTGGAREGSIRALQALMGLATILVAFGLGRAIARPILGGPADADGRGDPGGRDGPPGEGGDADPRLPVPAADAAGLLAALAVAVYPPFIHSTGATMSEPAATLLLASMLLATIWAGGRQGPAVRWAVPGLLAGLLALTRPEYLVVGIATAAIAAWGGGRPVPKRFLTVGAVFLAAMALPILPWTVHNLNTLDRVVPISTGSGKALYVGTYLPGDGEYQRTKAILAEEQLGLRLEPGSPELNAVDPRPLFDTIAARYPDLPRDSALGRVGREQGEDYLTSQPLSYAAMTARKVWRMWSKGQGGLMDATFARVLQVVVVLAGLAGLAVLARRRRWFEAALCGIPILAVTAIGAVTLASDRRGQVLMPLLFALGALAVMAALAARPQRDTSYADRR